MMRPVVGLVLAGIWLGGVAGAQPAAQVADINTSRDVLGTYEWPAWSGGQRRRERPAADRRQRVFPITETKRT